MTKLIHHLYNNNHTVLLLEYWNPVVHSPGTVKNYLSQSQTILQKKYPELTHYFLYVHFQFMIQ
jgi:hypothetical protein